MKNILIDIEIHASALRELKAASDIKMQVVEPAEEARVLPTEKIQDTEILFCTCPPKNIAEMKNLQWIQIGSVGYEQVLGLGLSERGVRVCNARGVFDVPIAEWNIAMMINLLRDMKSMIANQQAGIWDRDARFQKELRGLTVGIWGYGGIGRETARLAKTMGLQIHVMTRDGVKTRDLEYAVVGTGDASGVLPDRVFTSGQEIEFLSELDFLILALPLTPQSEGLIGKKELRALKPSAYVLNPARGPIIQEKALLTALTEKWIAGAALDTHYHYPMPPDHPLWKCENVIMTPHISGSSQSPHFLSRLWDIFAQNVARDLIAQPLLNELSPAQLKGQ